MMDIQKRQELIARCEDRLKLLAGMKVSLAEEQREIYSIALAALNENWQERAEKAEAQIAELAALTVEPIYQITIYGKWHDTDKCEYLAASEEERRIVYATPASPDAIDAKRRAFIDSLADDTAPPQYESLSLEAALKMGMERYGTAMKKLADKGDN